MHIPAVRNVKRIVTRLALIILVSVSLGAADMNLDTLLKGVEQHYNRAKTLQVQFNESYLVDGRPRKSESGLLTLRKPGRMRWDYTEPAGKLFVSDGKDVYLYIPDANRVEKTKLKASEDMRAPLAFLLGKLDFSKEFRDFDLKQQGANFILTAKAKNDKLPYEKIVMTIAPAYTIQRLVITGQDQSILSFQFDQEKLNPSVNDALFKFQMPAGATLVSEGE